MWDNHDITSRGSTRSDTNFTDNHVHSSISNGIEPRYLCELNWRSMVSTYKFRVVLNHQTFTVLRTPSPALDTSSSRVQDDLDLISTSGFEEWSKSWNEETEVISNWDSSRSNVEFHSTDSPDTVIIGSNGGLRISFVGVSWETVRNVHISISLGSFNSSVKMQECLDWWVSRTRTSHFPKDIDKLLVGCTESTSSSNSCMSSSRHI